MGHAPLVVSTEGCDYTLQVTIFRNSKPLGILMARGFILSIFYLLFNYICA